MEDKLIFTMLSLCVVLAFQAVVQLVIASKKPNGASAMKDLIEAIQELQERGQKDMVSEYPPEKFRRMHDRVLDIHGVVVTGERRGAIAQIHKTGDT